MANTGYLGYNTLEEYFLDSPSTLTGREKANVSGDPNYVAPVYNTGACSITTDVNINFNIRQTGPKILTITASQAVPSYVDVYFTATYDDPNFGTTETSAAVGFTAGSISRTYNFQGPVSQFAGSFTDPSIYTNGNTTYHYLVGGGAVE